MNWSDTLPANEPVVKAYRDVQERFGNAGGIVVVLEGDYERITALARIHLSHSCEDLSQCMRKCWILQLTQRTSSQR